MSRIMARLPHYPNFSVTQNNNPIYKNLCEVNFGDKLCEDTITKLSKNKIYFNLNINKLEILDYLLQSINNKEVIKLVEFKYHNREGVIIYRIIVENFRFTKIVNLLDFDYSTTTELKKLEVKFKYDNYYFVTEDKYLVFMRKLKIENIGESTIT